MMELYQLLQFYMIINIDMIYNVGKRKLLIVSFFQVSALVKSINRLMSK